MSLACKIEGHHKCARAEVSAKLQSDKVLVEWLCDGIGLPDVGRHMGLPHVFTLPED